MILASHDSSFSAWILAAIVVTVVVIGLHWMKLKKREEPSAPGRRLRWFEWMPYAAFLLALIVLAATSFGSILRFGDMSQWSLLVHLGAAGAFVFLLVAVTAIWAPQSQGGEQSSAIQGDQVSPFWWLSQWTFWLMVIGSIVTACSMLLGMLPIFSTSQLNNSIAVHRYAGLFVFVVTSLHCYSVIVRAKGIR